jgi:hypothetical protein
LASLMRVDAAGRSWFANCAWDAFGIGVVLGGDTVIHTECPDCAEPIELAEAWWGDRLAPDWQPRTRDQNQKILDGLGLTGPFWQLG